MVAAKNSAGLGPRTPPFIVEVDDVININTTVKGFRMLEASSNTIWLAWDRPEDIEHPRYLVTYT